MADNFDAEAMADSSVTVEMADNFDAEAMAGSFVTVVVRATKSNAPGSPVAVVARAVKARAVKASVPGSPVTVAARAVKSSAPGSSVTVVEMAGITNTTNYCLLFAVVAVACTVLAMTNSVLQMEEGKKVANPFLVLVARPVSK